MHPRPVVPDRPNSAVLPLRGPRFGQPVIASIGHMSPAGFLSVTFVMNPLTEDATITGRQDPRDLRDPHDHLLLGRSGVVGMVADRVIGLRKDSIVASADGLGLPAPLVLRIPGIGGTAVPALDRVVSMKERQTSQCLGGLREMCQKCRCLSWKKLIGTLRDAWSGSIPR